MHTDSLDREKYAIIGMGCRMPPSAVSLESFWKFLLRGGNAMKPVRQDRWDWRQYFDEDPSRPGKMYAPKFGMLDADVKYFDPLAFGISPREASSMDPQQRLLLEVAWEAFEDAGVPLESISGSATGVFVGGFCLDHLVLQSRPSNRHLINAQSPAAATMTILSNRLSHVFNLHGPSFTLDTACSSSLVALHCACRSLRSGDCEIALAGGVSVMTQPDFPILMSKGHFLSTHGECHAFSETAAGYARGEGAGILIIKPYEKAVEAGDRIHAIICGTGVNQDGHTDGISFPSSAAQEMLIRSVYERSGVPAALVDYVEAHGTGTQAGDPAEARALHVNFTQGRRPENKLLVGSVKTNIGHLEAAAGMAGLLKAIGVLKFRKVPRNLHFEKPNPAIPFDQYCLKVASETTDLPPESEKPTLYAGVNSFGYGGTNAHIILESAPPVTSSIAEDTAQGLRIIPFSARNESALRDLAGKMAFQIGQGRAGSFQDLAYTSAFRRSHLGYRCAAVTDNLEQLREQLISVSTGQSHEGIFVAPQAAENPPRIVFVYTGMGPQWWGMGRELMQEEGIFSSTIDEIDAHFIKLSGWSLREAMLADELHSRMERTEVAQPANFAIQVALTRLWASYGIKPAAVVGHSVGEVASGYSAGIYSLAEAVRVSYHRSRLQQTAAGSGGAMLAVGLNEDDARKWIEKSHGVSIAAVNSFHAVTLSGNADQLRDIAAELEKAEIFQKFLRVEVAYHSPHMDVLKDELAASLRGLSVQPSSCPLYSTVFGKRVSDEEWDSEYWWANVRHPVHFAQAVQSLIEEGFTSFLEVGPHPVLGNSIKECAAHLERRVDVFPSLRRKEPEKKRLLQSLGEMYCAGEDLNWKALAPERGNFIPGPQYSWQRQEYWLESDQSKMERLGLPGPVYLNRSRPGPQPGWEVEINKNYFPFLSDHGVQNQTVFAGMGYVEAALSLGRRLFDSPGILLENISFERVLVIEYDTLQYLVTEFESDAGRFTISSRVEGEPDSAQIQCRGRLLPQSTAGTGKLEIAAWRRECQEEVSLDAFYGDLQSRGLHYGPAFRPTKEVFVGTDCFLVRIDTTGLTGENHALHPAVFDAAIQPVLYCAGGNRLFVPFSIDRFVHSSSPASTDCLALGRLISKTDSMIVADVWLTSADGDVYAHAHRMSCRTIDTEATDAGANFLYSPDWKEAEARGDRAGVDGHEVLIVADAEDSDLQLAEDLMAALPGAELVLQQAPAPDGFNRESASLLFARDSYAGRNRIILLHGSACTSGDSSIGRLSEKMTGLLQAIGGLRSEGVDITLVTRAAKPVRGGQDIRNLSAFPLSALGLVAQNEWEFLFCRSIDLPEDKVAEEAGLIVQEVGANSRGDIAFRDGRRFEQALTPYREETNSVGTFSTSVEEPVELRVGGEARRDALQFEMTERQAPQESEIELRVHCVSLNYKDILKREGRIHPIALEDTFWGTDPGMECTGIVVRCGKNSRFVPGDRVVTILSRAFRSYATIPDTFAVKIPDGLGMEAAAIPVVYVTAYRGLVEIANLQPGERILIHNATGGLGLAAINIAQWIGAEIYATAGSPEKIRFLQDLGIRHVFSSRSLDFGQGVREATNQRGVDVVIGALTGQSVHVGLGLLAGGGRYIEVGKKDIAEDHDLPLRAFNRNLVYASLDIDRLAKDRPALIQQALGKVLEHFSNGDFHLTSTRTFPAREIETAFLEMARSRHMGKLLIDFSSGEVDVRARAERSPAIRSDGAYIVTGGTSGFGLMTGRWLASQGAGKVILASRSGDKAPGMQEAIAFITSQGCESEILSVDVTDLDQVSSMVERCRPFSLRGVIHGAMVLDDARMSELSEERFRRVFLPKVAGALNLASTLKHVPSLDFLVFYSSISALIGNPGQANYVVANSLLDGLAHSLRANGIPALSINWGALAESGIVARDARLESVLAAAGITGLGDREALTALEKLLRLSPSQMGVFNIQWETWHRANPKLADDPRFHALLSVSGTQQGGDMASQIRQRLSSDSREQRLRSLEEILREALASTLKMSREDISPTRKLNEMGVDSLMVLELGLGIKERLGIGFSAMELLKGQNLQQLAILAENRLWNGAKKITNQPQT